MTAIPANPFKSLHDRFLALVPRIEAQARVYFRHLKCSVKKEEAVAETLALAWKWFLWLVQRGKDAAQFVGQFAAYAAKAVRNGRRICGQEKSKDVLSPFYPFRGKPFSR